MHKPIVETSVEVAIMLDLVVLSSEFRELDRYSDCRLAILSEQRMKPRQLFLERQYEVTNGVAGALICDDLRYVDFKYLPARRGQSVTSMAGWDVVSASELVGELEIQLNLWWVANLKLELNDLVDTYAQEYCRNPAILRPSVTELSNYKHKIIQLIGNHR